MDRIDDINFGIAVHGGAGYVKRELLTKKTDSLIRSALQNAVNDGFSLLESNASAIQAVEAAIISLEDCAWFNAGRGSVYTENGTHEMDAAIMCGKARSAGGVALVSRIKNPIRLALEVMNHSQHVLLTGKGAARFAREYEIEFASEDYFRTKARWKEYKSAKGYESVGREWELNSLILEDHFGTVGAVALDAGGNLCAGTSTGGTVNKRIGRIGDTPIVGAGTYADNDSCAISATGHGEYFLRLALAKEISSMMKWGGTSLDEAASSVIFKQLRELGGLGGVIGIDLEGNISAKFNTHGMFRAFRSKCGSESVDILSDSGVF